MNFQNSLAPIVSEDFSTYPVGASIDLQSGGTGFANPGTWIGSGGTINNVIVQNSPNSLQLNQNGNIVTRQFYSPLIGVGGLTIYTYKTGGLNNLLFGLGDGFTDPTLYVQVEGSGGGVGAPNEITVRWNGIVIRTGIATLNTWNQVDVQFDSITGDFMARVNMGAWTPISNSGVTGTQFTGVATVINGSNGPDYIDAFTLINTPFLFSGVKYPLIEAPSKEVFDQMRIFPYNY